MADHEDELLNRAIDELRTLPPLDRNAVARVVSAAARAREMGPAEDDDLEAPRRERGRMFRVPAVASIAAAAAIIGFVAGSYQRPNVGTESVTGRSASSQVAVQSESAVQARLVADDRSALAPIATPFVFESSTAQRVSLVGDFNSWDDQAAVLERVPGTSRWTTTLRLTPGRHVYAFMVDGELQVDPNAPKAVDRELNVATSVVIVGKP